MKYFINHTVVLMRPPQGPLAAFIRPFSSWVSEQGYRSDSLLQRIRIAVDFSRWLGERALRPPNVHAQHGMQYLRYRARCRKMQRGDCIALSQFREFLCRHGVIETETAPPSRLTPVEQCAQEFEQYLREQRLLAQATIVNYVPFIGRFLKHRFGAGSVELSTLSAQDVVRFVQRQAPRLHLKRAKLLTCALRSFLRYGCYRGEIRSGTPARTA